jgi:hypothetical protein
MGIGVALSLISSLVSSLASGLASLLDAILDAILDRSSFTMFGILLCFAISIPCTSIVFAEAPPPPLVQSTPQVAPSAGGAAPSSTSSEFDFLQALDYPELQVVPRASDKLMMEAQFERESGWGNYLPFQLSAGVTIISGLMLDGKYKADFLDPQKADMDFATKGSVAVGVAWLSLTYYLYQQQPYASDLAKIKNIKGKDKRSDLTRERLSEEALERSSRVMKIATWGSVLSNLAINGVVLARTDHNNSLYPAAGLVAAFLPLIFQSRYIVNYDKHLEYKRKIYAPVATLLPFQPRVDGSGGYIFEPQMVLTWRY